MMLPFLYVSHNSAGESSSQEERLARRMGKPPLETGSVPASIPASAWAKKQLAQDIGLIFDDEFWYSPGSWKRWLNAIEDSGTDGRINVPVGNQDPSWRSCLEPSPYLTVRGLENAANKKGPKRWVVRRCFRPDGFGIAVVPVALLTHLPTRVTIGDLPEYWAEKGQEVRIFCEGWLHAFNVLSEALFRKDLLELCGWHGKVLELGCGKGQMARACREMGNDVTWVGIDIQLSSLRKAAKWMDLAIHADVRKPLPLVDNIRFDRMVCADVLEHTPYPWEVLKNLRNLIRPDGLLVASVPNIGHWMVIEDLLAGRFDEAPAGILCVGHLRFGTRRNWETWFRDAGWSVTFRESSKVPLPDDWIVSKRRLRDMCDHESLETVQYRLTARPR